MTGKSFGDEFDALAAELRRGPGSELFEELQITEAETELARLRQRRLSDVLTEAMHRGDTVEANTRFGVVRGTVDYVGADYFLVVTRSADVALRADRCAVRIERSPEGGHTVSGGSRTFTARLAEYASTGEIVTLLVPELRLELTGQVTIVAADHVVIIDLDDTTTVPLAQIDAVRRHH